MHLRTLIVLFLLPGISHWLSAQQETSIPVTVRLASNGNVLFKAAPDAKQYGLLASDLTLVRQLENKNGLLIYTPDAAKDKEHPLFTVGLLPTQTMDLQVSQGDVQFEDINNSITGRIGRGNIIVKGGKATVSLQLQTGDITVQHSQWQGAVITSKGNILLEDSPLLEGHTANGTLIYRYTDAGLKDKKQLVQQFDKARIELTGSVPTANLKLLEGQIVMERKVDNAHLAIRDKGDIAVKQTGERLDARTKKGNITIDAAEKFESLTLVCEEGTVTLNISRSFQGTVKLISDVLGQDKPDFKISNFWQEKQGGFEPIMAEEKAVPGMYRYQFEKKLGEDPATLFIHVKNGHLLINPLQ